MNDIDRLEQRVKAICAYLGIDMDLCSACCGTGWQETKKHPCGCCTKEEGGDCPDCKGTGWTIEKNEQ